MKRGQLLRRSPLRRGRPPRRAPSPRSLFWDWARRHTIRRAGYACERCGERRGRFDVHHRQPRARGGSDDPANLVALCRRCHTLIHAHLVTDWWCWITPTGPQQ